MNPTRHDWLGRSLGTLYDQTVERPLPESLQRLLEELQRKEEERS